MLAACATCSSREYARKTYRLRTYGQWDPKGDVDAVIEHLDALAADRVGLKRISELTGLSRSTIFRIRSGKNKWVTKAVADAILGVNPRDTVRINPVGTSRRIRALMAIGWSTYYMADRLGIKQARVWDLSKGRSWVTPKTHRLVAEMYAELCMTPGPSSISRSRALRAGHLPPLAWSDIDDPDDVPDRRRVDRAGSAPSEVDHVVVQRILAGDWRTRATHAERCAVVAEWDGSHNELARLTGWRVERYLSEKEAS